MNILPRALLGARIHAPDAAAHVGVRPEHITLVDEGSAILSGEVGVAEHLGGNSYLYVDIPGVEEPITVRVAGGGTEIDDGARVHLGWSPEQTHFFDADGERVAG